MIVDLANEPTVRAALQLNQAKSRPASLKDKLLLIVPLPIGCYFAVKGLSVAADAAADPMLSLAAGLIRGLDFTGCLTCFFLSLRTYLKIRRCRD